VSISVSAFIFCLGFAVFLGCVFAWIYNYRILHKEPKGNPLRVTDTFSIPTELVANVDQEGSAIRRLEQEKTCYETGTGNKDAFIKKMLALFRSHLEKEKRNILSICYWAFNGESFTLRLPNTPYRINENLLIPQNNRYFSKKEFNWNGTDEIPIDIYSTEELMANSMAGAAISGSGKLRGYVTIDSTDPNAFDDDIRTELLELVTLMEEVLRMMDRNFKLDKENSLFNGMLKDISDLFHSSSKGNLIADLSEILQGNFRFNRLILITPHEQDKDRWQIVEAAGEQKEVFKGVSFNVHVKCLLYELLAGKISVINEKKISTDPYQRRFYENEPENLELRSLFAVGPPLQNNSYPLVIVIESRNDRAVSVMDEIMLTCIVACASLKLSDIENKDISNQEKENALAEVDSNGLGEILNYYEREIESLENSNDSVAILFLKCIPLKKEGRAAVFEKFLAMLKRLKKAWNGRHLAMLGSGEFVLSVKGKSNENVPEIMATQIRNLLDGEPLSIKSHSIWLNKDKIKEIEKKLGQGGKTLFLISIANKFQEMSEASL
jgi:hypothetical protein